MNAVAMPTAQAGGPSDPSPAVSAKGAHPYRAETVNTWFGTVPIVVYPGDGGWHAMTDPWRSTYGAWGHDPETAIARLKSWAAKWMPQ